MKHTGGCWSLGDFTRHIFKHLCDFFLGIPDEQVNLGHLCFSVQMSCIKMVTIDEIREYLNTLNSVQIVWLWARLADKRASLIRQNLEPSYELLVVLELLREQIHNRFE